MVGRILMLVVFFCVLNIQAQKPAGSSTPPITPNNRTDKLIEHLRAAERHQRAGDMVSADIENRAVLGIALQRSGRIALEEGRFSDASENLATAIKYLDTAENRTSLAVAFQRQNRFDEALEQANAAVAIDPNHIGGHYILGNLYYSREDYKSARPILEKVFSAAPDFEVGRALGFTYLNLKQPERARELFGKIKALVGKERAGLHILFAKFYERTNYPADAERELKRALAIDPNEPRANFFLGYLLLQHGGSGRVKEAGEAFERELKLTPNEFFSNFFAGVAASGENNHPKAIGHLKKAIEINSNSGEAHMFLAQSQIELNDLENAERNLRRAVLLETAGKKNTQARRTHFMLGRLLLKTGRRDEGRKELEIASKLQRASLDSSRNSLDRLLSQAADKTEPIANLGKKQITKADTKLEPERVEQLKKVKKFLSNVIAQSFNNLGVIAIQDNRLGDAISQLSSAYIWKPDFPSLSRNLGIVSFRANEFKKAIAPLARHLSVDPNDLLVRKMLGSSYHFTKDHAKSVDVLKPVEASLLADPELAYFYGISLVRLKRNGEAAPVFSRLAINSRQNPEALFYAAQGFMILGNYQRAIKEFSRVLVLAPQTSKANYFIGQSYIRLNSLKEAEKYFGQELLINPADAISKYHLALTLIERKIETDRAIRILEEAVSLRYDYADALYQLGKIFLEMGDAPKAVSHLERAVRSDGKKDYIHYQLSIAYRKVSRKQDAERELKEYQRLKREKRKNDSPLPMGGNDDSLLE